MQLHDNHSYRARTMLCDASPERVYCSFKNRNFVFFEELTASPCYKTTNILLASTKKGTCLASLTSQSIIFDYCFRNITQSERQNKGKVIKTALIVKDIPFRHKVRFFHLFLQACCRNITRKIKIKNHIKKIEPELCDVTA